MQPAALIPTTWNHHLPMCPSTSCDQDALARHRCTPHLTSLDQEAEHLAPPSGSSSNQMLYPPNQTHMFHLGHCSVAQSYHSFHEPTLSQACPLTVYEFAQTHVSESVIVQPSDCPLLLLLSVFLSQSHLQSLALPARVSTCETDMWPLNLLDDR